MTAPYQPAAPQQPAPSQPRNGLGTAGFVTGLIGLVFSPIPIVGMIAWPLVIVGLVLSALGVSRAVKGEATNKGLSIAGLVVSVVGLVICILWVVAFGKAADDLNKAANSEATVVYEVTGDAKDASITYSSFDNGAASTNQEQAATLPWKKELKTKGILKGGSVTALAGPDGGTVSCKVTIDGVEKKTATATGPAAMASCTGF
ncbi:DUF4190 domain-containing protein [Solihabitans fulvus]|uniref:DUF4190 domain-containing protein n=2 Tax=Solihabitans fulvus TaxID=1892852 RepID=A0A5B2XNL0_9PSEU|nr:DUF4190 domain-containing protein [Solihabitans fulvus]